MHGTFYDHRTLVSGGDDFKGFGHMWAWRPSWSCDQDHFYKIYVPTSQRGSILNLALKGHVVSEQKLLKIWSYSCI